MNVTTDQQCADILALMAHGKGSVLQLAEEHGLTPVQLFSLYSLDQQGETSMGRVAETLHCDASNITGIVDRLTAQGLVVRKDSLRDRRAKTLVLTAKGQEIITSLKAALPDKFGYSRLTEQERTALHTIAQKVCV